MCHYVGLSVCLPVCLAGWLYVWSVCLSACLSRLCVCSSCMSLLLSGTQTFPYGPSPPSENDQLWDATRLAFGDTAQLLQQAVSTTHPTRWLTQRVSEVVHTSVSVRLSEASGPFQSLPRFRDQMLECRICHHSFTECLVRQYARHAQSTLAQRSIDCCCCCCCCWVDICALAHG